MRIRNDLDGVVYVSVGGDVTGLTAGDEIPDGVTVGEHLLDDVVGDADDPDQSLSDHLAGDQQADVTVEDAPVEAAAPENTAAEPVEIDDAPAQEAKSAGNSRGRRSATRA